jgi:hypothetical protein
MICNLVLYILTALFYLLVEKEVNEVAVLKATLLVPLVICADSCYTFVTCSANDAFVLFQAGYLLSPLRKETNCVSAWFRAWAARHDAPPGLAHPAGYRVTGHSQTSSFAAPPLCAFSGHASSVRVILYIQIERTFEDGLLTRFERSERIFVRSPGEGYIPIALNGMDYDMCNRDTGGKPIGESATS